MIFSLSFNNVFRSFFILQYIVKSVVDISIIFEDISIIFENINFPTSLFTLFLDRSFFMHRFNVYVILVSLF